MNKATVIVAFLIFITSALSAQSLKSSAEQIATLNAKDAEHLQSLMKDIQTTVYIENGEMKVFGDGMPVYVKADVNGIKQLSEKNAKFSAVEFLEIKLNNKGEENLALLNPAMVSGLTNLKYILVRSSYELSKTQFEKIFSGFDGSGIALFYEVSIPN